METALQIIIASHLLIPLLGIMWYGVRAERRKLKEEKEKFLKSVFWLARRKRR